MKKEREREREEVDEEPNLPGVFFFFFGRNKHIQEKGNLLGVEP